MNDSNDLDSANTALTPATPAASKPANVWEKGMTSPNRKGRPPMSSEVKEVLRARTVDALTVLVDVMVNKKAKDADRIRAAEAFLDRALGKAPQAVALTGDDGGAVQVDVRAGLLAAVTRLVDEPK